MIMNNSYMLVIIMEVKLYHCEKNQIIPTLKYTKHDRQLNLNIFVFVILETFFHSITKLFTQ